MLNYRQLMDASLTSARERAAHKALVNAKAERERVTRTPPTVGTGFLNLVSTAYATVSTGPGKSTLVIRNGKPVVTAWIYRGSVTVPGGESLFLECTQRPEDTERLVEVKRFDSWEKLCDMHLPLFEGMPYVDSHLPLGSRKYLVRARYRVGDKYIRINLPEVAKADDLSGLSR